MTQGRLRATFLSRQLHCNLTYVVGEARWTVTVSCLQACRNDSVIRTEEILLTWSAREVLKVDDTLSIQIGIGTQLVHELTESQDAVNVPRSVAAEINGGEVRPSGLRALPSPSFPTSTLLRLAS